MSGKSYTRTLDSKAVKIIQENAEFEGKIRDLLADLPAERKGMILSSLLVKVAIEVDMPREELLDIVDDLYNVGIFGFN